MGTSNASVLAVDGGQPAVDERELRLWPEITDADLMVVADALRTDPNGVVGRNVTALRDEVGEYTGKKHVLPVNTGAAACYAALVSAGVRPGDEVISTALSFQATILAILQIGAVPVICDIDERTFNIDFADAERLVTPRTRAIFVVHSHGLLADMSAAASFASRHKQLAIVEDACQAFGGMLNGRMAGDFGVTAAFSLARAKPWTALVGGIVATDDLDRDLSHRYTAHMGERRQALRPRQTRSYWCEQLGYNFTPHPAALALALAQLPRVNGYLDRARSNLAILQAGAAGIPGLIAPYIPPGYDSSVAYARFLLDFEKIGWDGDPREGCDRVMDALWAENVKVSRWQVAPLSALPVVRGRRFTPWYPGKPADVLPPIDRGLHPTTWHVLDHSFILGEEPYMLHVQTERAMIQTVRAFEKVFEPANMHRVLTRPYEAFEVVPPIPSEIMRPGTIARES
jgi:perosamine synthetase